MKNQFRSLAFIALISIATLAVSNFAVNKKNQATVTRVLGKYVFIMSQPTLEYQVVDDISTTGTTLLTGKKSIDDQIQEMIKRGIKRVDKGKIEPFDAIVTPDGKNASLIKFKD